jgi:hypothetical protein
MPIVQGLLVETFKVYTYAEDSMPNDIGEWGDSYTVPAAGFSSGFSSGFASESSNMEVKGQVKGRITPGDSLEPDVLGALKVSSIDVSSMWIGFFNPTEGFKLETGDWVQSTTDSTRKFQVQFIDRYPGGKFGHHYECRLLTTELERNQ